MVLACNSHISHSHFTNTNTQQLYASHHTEVVKRYPSGLECGSHTVVENDEEKKSNDQPIDQQRQISVRNHLQPATSTCKQSIEPFLMEYLVSQRITARSTCLLFMLYIQRFTTEIKDEYKYKQADYTYNLYNHSFHIDKYKLVYNIHIQFAAEKWKSNSKTTFQQYIVYPFKLYSYGMSCILHTFECFKWFKVYVQQLEKIQFLSAPYHASGYFQAIQSEKNERTFITL